MRSGAVPKVLEGWSGPGGTRTWWRQGVWGWSHVGGYVIVGPSVKALPGSFRQEEVV